MPRKGPAPKRPIMVDPVYGSPLVSQLVSKILLDGKKTVAQSIVYNALEGTRAKTGQDPVQTLKRALDNVKPSIEVKSHTGHALARQLLPRPPREDHDRAAHERDSGRLQRARRFREAPRRCPQDGRGQPRLRPLPLVIALPPGFRPGALTASQTSSAKD